MTAYEYLDLAASYHDTAISALMGYFTVLTAYFVVAYAAGAAMKRDQVLAATGLFLVVASFLTWGVVGYWHAARELSLLGDFPFVSRVPAHMIALPMLTIGIFSGLKFMWDVRRSKAE